MNITEIIDNFSYLDEWEDRYKYVIELGKMLEPMDDAARSSDNKVQGCASQVWLQSTRYEENGAPHLHYVGDSDALIVRGLIAITLAIYNDRDAQAIINEDAEAIFERIQLREHISGQRSNGLSAMLQRIKQDAAASLS